MQTSLTDIISPASVCLSTTIYVTRLYIIVFSLYNLVYGRDTNADRLARTQLQESISHK